MFAQLHSTTAVQRPTLRATLTRATFAGAPLVAILTAAIACARTTEGRPQVGVLSSQPAPEIWMGTMRPVGHSTLQGNAALTPGDQPNETHLMVSMRGVAPGDRYGWRLQTGSCDRTGRQIAASAASTIIVPHQDGTANADVTIAERLDRDTVYAITVNNAQTAERVACGQLAFRVL